MLQHSLLSIADKLPFQTLKQGIIVFGNEFHSLGYGLILVRTFKYMKGDLVIKFDAGYKFYLCRKLEKEGYRVIEKYSMEK